MSARRHILLVNPTITARRNARFPLAVLSLAAALEGRYAVTVLDGNVDREYVATALRLLASHPVDALGVTVMGGPQLRSAIALCQAVRARWPTLPVVWGGAFPTNCPDAALRAPYVDFAVRGQGEETFAELLETLFGERSAGLASIAGLSWRDGAEIVHNALRPFSAASLAQRLPYERLHDPRSISLAATLAGAPRATRRRSVAASAAPSAAWRPCSAARRRCRRRRASRKTCGSSRALGADAIQFYDHNFFDREVDMVPLLEILARFELPWWCFARSDALLNLSERSWAAGAQEPAAHGLYRRRVAERLAAARYPQGHALAIRPSPPSRRAAATA